MSELDYARECGTEPEPAENERVKEIATDSLDEVLQFPHTSDPETYKVARAQLAALKASLLPVQPAASTPTEKQQMRIIAREIAIEVGRYLILGGISDAAVDDVAHNIILPRIVAAASTEAQDERD